MSSPGGTAPERPAEAKLWSPLAHRDFALLWGGYVLSHVGDSIQLNAQNWLVTDLTRSGFRVGAVALAQSIPRLLLGVFGGVLVDRVDRRRMLMVTQALAMVQSVAFLVLVATGRITYPWVVFLSFVLGVLDTLNLNARVAMMPSLVPRPLLGKAVALQALGVNVVQIAGPALTGLLIGRWGVEGCLAVNVGSFLVLLCALGWMRPAPVQGERAASQGFVDELREGFAFVRARPLLRASITLAYLVGLLGVSTVRLLALFSREALHVNAAEYSHLAMAVGLGAICASVLVTARSGPARLPTNIAAGAFLLGLAVIAVGLSRGYLVAACALAVLGFGQMTFRSAVMTSIQLETPDRLRGRVVSLLTLDFALWSIGAVLAGALADVLATRALGGTGELSVALGRAFVVLGAVCLVCVALLGRVAVRQRVTTGAGGPSK